MAEEQSALKRVWQTVKKYAVRVGRYLKAAKMEYIVMVGLLLLDLISKAIVNATTKVYETVVLIPKFLNIHNIHNYDAAFGSEWMTKALGAMGARILFCIFAVIASVVFIIILIKNKGGHKLLRVSFAMLIAGALGNCFDRMFLGYVRDFVEFVYFGFTIGGQESFYVFNIADAELVIGVILVLIYFIFLYRDKPEKAALETESNSDAASTGTVASDDNAPSAENGENIKPQSDDTGEIAAAADIPETDDSAGASAEPPSAENIENTEANADDVSAHGAQLTEEQGSENAEVTDERSDRSESTESIEQEPPKAPIVDTEKPVRKRASSSAPKSNASEKPTKTTVDKPSAPKSGTTKSTTKTSGGAKRSTGTSGGAKRAAAKKTTAAKPSSSRSSETKPKNNADTKESADGENAT